MAVTIVARPRTGTVGETQRVAHLFPLPAGEFATLTAYCGERFGPGELELLPRPSGMPCERCLLRAPRA